MALCNSLIALRKGRAIVFVPCGKCNFCLQNRRADWTFRILEELKQSSTALFLTFTYDEKNVPIVPDENGEAHATLRKRDIQLFLKKLRKLQTHHSGNGKSGIKYYFVGEYGEETFRPHYHAIIFNILPSVIERIQEIWDAGFVSAGQVQPASVHYVTKYVLNPSNTTGWLPLSPPFSLVSKGIGQEYLLTNGHEHKKTLKNFVVNSGSAKQRLPRYYKDKIFNIREREALSQSSIDEYDILYQKSIAHLETKTETPENYHDFCFAKSMMTSKSSRTKNISQLLKLSKT